MNLADPDRNPLNLPNFCQPQALLLLILLGAMLAILLTLAGIDTLSSFWVHLGLTSIFIQTVLLSVCLVLCNGRTVLAKLPAAIALLMIFLLIQVLVALYSWFAVSQFPALISNDANLGQHYFILRNLAISILASLVFLRYLVLHRKWQLQVQAESTARLATLQARIRPHFLFNALNTVASLIQTRPEQAEQAVLDLADLLRTGLRENSKHSVEEELDLVRGYLRIESLRLGNRLRLQWALDDAAPLQQSIPALLIQPLVENAIVHGISKRPDGGTLTLRSTWKDRGHWQIQVINPMAGQKSQHAHGHGMSLDNIQKRLALAFEEGARLNMNQSGKECTVTLVLPFKHTSS